MSLAADLAAMAIPYVPAGATKLIKAGDKAVDAVKVGIDPAKSSVKSINTQKTYQTYTKSAKDPEIHGDYTGRTSGTGTPEQNIAKRDRNHHMNETHGPARLDKSSSNPDAIRGREQQNIEKNGGAKSQGGSSGNSINSVSPTNPKKKQYEDAAAKEFGLKDFGLSK